MSGPTLPASKKRSRGYSGIVLEPIKFVPDIIRTGECYEPAADWPPDVANRWRAAVRACLERDGIALLERQTELAKRIGALQEHYGINPEQPAWVRNLALCLAQDFEPELMADRNFAQVFIKYEMDPVIPGGESELALRIASKHLKGFQISIQDPERRPGVMNTAHLALADAIISQKLSASGQKPSVREVARIIRDPTELKRFLSTTAAEQIGEVLRENGNKEQGDIPRSLSCKQLRNYLGWMRSAWPSYSGGQELSQDAKSFQVQFVKKVLPLLLRLSER